MAAVRVIRGSMTIMLARLSSVANVVVAVRHRAVAPGIGDAGDGGGMADTRLMIGVVGAPECHKLAIQIGGFVGEFGRAQPIDRIRSGHFTDLQEFVADLVDSLLPREAYPLRVHKLHGVAQAPFA